MGIAYWGFPIEQDLYKAILIDIAELQTADEYELVDWQQRASMVLERLSQAALSTYYQQPAAFLQLEQPLRVTAEASAKVVMNSIRTVINQVVVTLSLSDLKVLAGYLHYLLWWNPQHERPYLAFPMDSRIHNEAHQLLFQVRQENSCNHYIGDVIHSVSQIVESCINHYYVKPIAALQASSLAHKASELNVRNVQRTVRTLLTRIISQLSQPELMHLSYHLESLIHWQPIGSADRNERVRTKKVLTAG